MCTQNNYQKLKLLGAGTYGRCYLAKNILNAQLCVLKEIDIAGMDQHQKAQAIKEASILSALHHPFIIHFTQSFTHEDDTTLTIVMGYADGGDLAHKIKQAKDTLFLQSQVLNWFTEICLAVKHVHDRRIIHRDLKTSNIFLTKQGTIKLGDFGIARPMQLTLEMIRTVVGTPHYMSPEICESKLYTLKTDIWSLGVVLYELCTFKQPFESNSLAGLALKISTGQYTPICEPVRKEIKDLIQAMLQVNPDHRPTVYQILENPLIKQRIPKLLPPKVWEKEFNNSPNLSLNNATQHSDSLNHNHITQSVSPENHNHFPLHTPHPKNIPRTFKENISQQKDNHNKKPNNAQLDKKRKKSQLRRREISEPNLVSNDQKYQQNNSLLHQNSSLVHQNKSLVQQNSSLVHLEKKKDSRKDLKKKSSRNQSDIGVQLYEIKQICSQVAQMRDQLSHRNDQLHLECTDSESEEQTIQETLKAILLEKVGLKQFRTIQQMLSQNSGEVELGQERGLFGLWYGLTLR